MTHTATAPETVPKSHDRVRALAIKYAAMDFGSWAIHDKQQGEQVESPRIGASAATRRLYIDDDGGDARPTGVRSCREAGGVHGRQGRRCGVPRRTGALDKAELGSLFGWPRSRTPTRARCSTAT